MINSSSDFFSADAYLRGHPLSRPFVAIKPRPLEPYGLAAMASMGGDHAVALAAFDQMPRERLSSQPTSPRR